MQTRAPSCDQSRTQKPFPTPLKRGVPWPGTDGATAPGAQRPARIADRSGHTGLGTGHRRAGGRGPAQGVLVGGRHLRGHGRRLRGRRCGARAGTAAGDTRAPPRPGHRNEGRQRARPRAPGGRLPRAPAGRPGRLTGAAGHRPRGPVAAARLRRRHAPRGNPPRSGHGRHERTRALRRSVRLLRLAARQSRDLAAGGPRRPYATGEHPGRVLAAATRRGTRGGARRAGPRHRGCSPAPRSAGAC